MDAILAMLESIASLDFSARLTISSICDVIDAIASGLNMLCEELESSVIRRSQLEEINQHLERFAYVAAHDMRSPLFVSSSLAHILADELKGHHTEQVDEHLDMLKAANEQMAGLITGILEYSRIGIAHVQMEEVDLGKLCSDIAEWHALDKDVIIEIDEAMPIVVHHQTALTQIIDNLVSNAVRHNDKETCEVRIQCDDRADYFELSIADNGPGIDEEKRERIFDLFENLGSGEVASAGIGLATVKKLVTATNGRLWVEPSASRGARFVFTINK